MAPLLSLDQIQKVGYSLQVGGRIVGLNTSGQHQLARHCEYIQMMLAMAIRQEKSWTVIPLPDMLVEDPEIIFIIAGQPGCARIYARTSVFQNIDLRKFFLLLGYLIAPEHHVLYMIQNFDFTGNSSLPQALYYLHSQLEWFSIRDFLAHPLHIEITPISFHRWFIRDIIIKIRKAERTERGFDESKLQLELRRLTLEHDQGHLHQCHKSCVICFPKIKNPAMARMRLYCISK